MSDIIQFGRFSDVIRKVISVRHFIITPFYSPIKVGMLGIGNAPNPFLDVLV